MGVLKFDLSKKLGSFKILNATNGGPWHARHMDQQIRSNFKDYVAARIPYSRNHDLGGLNPFSHDISGIFPNFDADVNDPESYYFDCTDESILVTLEAGTKTFYRLGQTIEHQIKKHHTLPPKDFQKWAEICEHIIRHYTEGWANGFTHDMPYWEIWNEADLDEDDSKNKKTWGGTKAQFFDMYEIVAKHLKKCFPHLKIGGPSLAFREDRAADFLREMKKRGVEIDFFSWHIYAKEPAEIIEKAYRIQKLVVESGYGDAELILNEWNYVRGWLEDFQYSINAIHGIKGASFVMSVLCEAQKCDAIDMLMYYDTRKSAFNGVFDYYSYQPLKGYYPLMWYGKFYDMEAEVRCETSPENIYTLCGVDKDGKAMCIVTNYSEDDASLPKDVKIDFGKDGKYEVYIVDSEKNGELDGVVENLEFTLKPHSFMLIKEV